MFSFAKKATKTLFLEPKSLLSLFLIDILFLISFLGILRILSLQSGYFAHSLSAASVFVALYVACGVIIYSIAKFMLLKRLSRLLGLKDALHFKQFIGLNALLFLAIFFVLVIAALLSQSIREPLTQYASAFFLGLFVLFSYLLLAASHSFFLHGFSIGKSLAKGFSNLYKLYPLLVVFVVFLLPIAIIFLISGTILSKTVFIDVVAFSKYYPWYLTIFGVFVSCVLYLSVFFNRFYALELLREKLKKEAQQEKAQ